MRSQKDKQGLMLIATCGLLLIGLVAARGVLSERRVGECNETPAASTVVILDRSEEMSAQTLNEIQSRALAFIHDSTSDDELVSVFTINDSSKASLAPLIALCRPPATGNPLIENVRMIQRRFRDKFEKPVATALEIRQASSRESPIAQTLSDISRTKYLRAKRNTLLVFSDMLENTSKFSLYGCRNPDDVIPAFRSSRVGAVERPTFINTRVVLNLIPRIGQTPQVIKCRDRLWTWFFGDDSGPNVALSVDYLPGGSAATTSAGRAER